MVNYKDKIEELKAKNVLDEEQAQKLSGVLHDKSMTEEPLMEESLEIDKKSHTLRWIAVFVVLFLLLFGVLYNSLVNKSESVDMAWSQVESTMQRKLDLIPNLVKVVKSYAKHESELLTQITSLRANAKDMLQTKDTSKLAKLNTKLNSSMMQLFAVAENYPDLKSSEHFLQLQAQLEGSENRINITRMMFNDAVANYNSAIRKMPQKFIANVMGLKSRAYFKAEKDAHKKLKVEM